MTNVHTPRPAICFDKDGTLLDDVPWNVDRSRMRLRPGAFEAWRMLAWLAVPLFVISKRNSVALGSFARKALNSLEARLHAPTRIGEGLA